MQAKPFQSIYFGVLNVRFDIYRLLYLNVINHNHLLTIQLKLLEKVLLNQINVLLRIPGTVIIFSNKWTNKTIKLTWRNLYSVIHINYLPCVCVCVCVRVRGKYMACPLSFKDCVCCLIKLNSESYWEQNMWPSGLHSILKIALLITCTVSRNTCTKITFVLGNMLLGLCKFDLLGQ